MWRVENDMPKRLISERQITEVCDNVRINSAVAHSLAVMTLPYLLRFKAPIVYKQHIRISCIKPEHF